ncbi:keratin, type I cytoskeletal 9 isoform X2 [Drosophila biarmipes]|uniref:keratin, type I cytoskeletal 9 isoform X2 n=1 Tax=Drosophila biarmipes TaxID=125945 RepID=UPI0007E7C3EC|nr:keratin, type I cytoskeletal 9 isoform X2 [Drosophila biarmipes]
MRAIMLLSCLGLLVCVQSAVTGPEARSSVDSKDQQLATASVGILDSVLRGKSRQSRCVRCYEDRDRDRYYSGYSSRTGDDLRGSSAWYYSGYDDRGSSRDRDYDRYYDRSRYYDDRYSPRTYDRYEGRGYDDYRRGSGYGGSYDRERGYGYDNRDRYYGGDRYSEGSSRDRYYDRSRSGGYDRYDPYDRYYSRYDFRNYRPWDETYRGQSGFDNSGRGYYFATDDDESDRSRGYGYSYARPSSSMSSPCGRISGNCPYAGGSKVTSSAIGSDSSRVGGHTNVLGSEGGPGSWTYLGDQDKVGGSSGSSSGSGGSSSSSSSGGSSGPSGSGGSRERERERDRERDAQSSSYGGRPRPLGVSYLLERDADTPSDGPGNTASTAGNGGSNGGGGAGGQSMPVPAAQTAAEGSSGTAGQ